MTQKIIPFRFWSARQTITAYFCIYYYNKFVKLKKKFTEKMLTCLSFTEQYIGNTMIGDCYYKDLLIFKYFDFLTQHLFKILFMSFSLWPNEKNSWNISEVKKGTEEDLKGWFPNSSLLHNLNFPLLLLASELCYESLRVAFQIKKSAI